MEPNQQPNVAHALQHPDVVAHYDGETRVLMYSSEGKPVPLPRPRFIRNGRAFHVFTPRSPLTGRFAIGLRGWLTREMPQAMPVFPAGRCLAVSIVYRLHRPNSHFTSNNRSHPIKDACLNIAPTSNGDIDNLAKYTLDALQDCAIHDDRQVVALCCTKIWSERHDSEGSTTVLVRDMF